jgi:spore coat protein A
MVTESARLVVTLQTATHRFHRDLPPSRVWAYDGSLPSPTIEVTRGVALEVRWENHLMRPFVVMSAELMPFMDMHMGRGHMAHMKHKA